MFLATRRGVAGVRSQFGLITRGTQVQILPPLPVQPIRCSSMAEQRAVNARVIGSSPVIGAMGH
jgi:hypothetical protein